MRLPKNIKLFGMTFEVEYFDFDKQLQCNNSSGNCKNYKQKIQIDSASTEEYQGHALLHEIIHLISTNLCLDLDEPMVRRLGSGIYAALLDNKMLAA